MTNRLLIIALLAFTASLDAAPPKVNYFFPAGVQRGQSVVVTANGDFSTWPVQIAADLPGVTATAETEKGKFRITIPADAVPGVVWLRAHNEEGASPQRPFMIGTLPEIEEVEPNELPSKPQTVPEKVVVNGRLAKNGDLDGFALPLKQGQTLVAALQAHEVLGSPMDAVLQVCELIERRGRPEAFVLEQNHDTVGLDPRVVFTAPRDGNYLVRVFAYPSEPGANIAYSGGDNYIYRLIVTTGAFLDHALPLAIERGKPSEVRVQGWNLPAGGLPVTLSPLENRSSLSAFYAEAANSIPVAVVEGPSIVASAGSTPAAPQVIATPISISGQLRQEREAHFFRFEAKKGTRLRIASTSRSIGFPTMAKLRLADAAAKQLAASEASDQKRDPEFIFAVPADGLYDLSLTDLFDRGGLRFVYRLTIEEPRPEFALTLAADSFVLTPGQPLSIPVTIAAPRSEITLPIELLAHDLPPGVTCDAVKSSAKAELNEVMTLVLKTEAAATLPASFAIRIRGASGATTRTARIVAGPVDSTVWITVKK